MSRTILMCALIAVIAPWPGGSARAGEAIHETRDVAEDATIRIGNVAGEVVVIGWDASRVEIEGELGEGTRRLEIEGDANRLEIVVVVPRRKRYVEDTDLEIRVPRRARVEIEGISCDVVVRDLERELFVETTSGDVEIDCDLRELTLETVSGDVDLRGAFGDCAVDLTSGDCEIVSKAVERLEIETISGDLELAIDAVGGLTVDTVSGELDFTGRVLKRADIETQSGGVELTFPGEPDASFEIATYNGEIDNSFGPRPRRRDRWEPEMELSFTAGGGDADIRVETFSGDVILDTK